MQNWFAHFRSGPLWEHANIGGSAIGHQRERQFIFGATARFTGASHACTPCMVKVEFNYGVVKLVRSAVMSLAFGHCAESR